MFQYLLLWNFRSYTWALIVYLVWNISRKSVRVGAKDIFPISRNTFDKTKPVKVVDSCRTCSTECSDTFRSFFVCGKEQESRKKICYHRAKKIHLPKGV